VIDGKASTEVDTVAELQDLANRVDFFLGVAAKANDFYSGALPTAADWAALLVSGVNPENLSRMNSILYATDGDGADAYTTADFDTVAEIQDWVNVFTNPPVM
jgi:NAD(P)H-dependent FMN reductase